VRTIAQAARWIDETGLALLYPKGDYVLTSLYEAIAGHSDFDWDADEAWTVWEWKDELAAERLACVGQHLVGTTSAIAPRLVSGVYALTEEPRSSLAGLELEIAEASRSLRRPATRAELRLLVGTDKRLGDRAINALQRKLVLTNAGVDYESSHWGATLHDLLARRWRTKLRRLPTREDALASLAASVVRSAGEVSAADIAAALRIRRREATETLERLEAEGAAAPVRRDDLRLWIPAARESRARSRAAGSRSSPRRSR
jgi:hypothetical protein